MEPGLGQQWIPCVKGETFDVSEQERDILSVKIVPRLQDLKVFNKVK